MRAHLHYLPGRDELGEETSLLPHLSRPVSMRPFRPHALIIILPVCSHSLCIIIARLRADPILVSDDDFVN